MDRLKDLANDAGNIADQVDRLSFPIGKAELITELEQRGIPAPLLEQLRTDDTNSYQNRDAVLDRIGAQS